MSRIRLTFLGLLGLLGMILAAAVVSPLQAADPPTPAANPLWFNPLKGMVHSPLTAEFEVYTGGLSGQSVGAAYRSAAQGNYGLRFTFGFLKAVNFSLGYMYSNQTRTLSEGLPPIGGVPTGTVFLHAANLNMAYGDGELNFLHTNHAVFYLSPGLGVARNGSRNLSVTTPFGSASAPIGPGTALTFNLGAGIKIFPRKHWGVRLDARDFVSGGGTGGLSASLNCQAIGCPSNPIPFLGQTPINNNVVFTVGLIFKLL
jgi:hypothetical protein